MSGLAYSGVAANVAGALPLNITEPADGDADNGATFQLAMQKQTDIAQFLLENTIAFPWAMKSGVTNSPLVVDPGSGVQADGMAVGAGLIVNAVNTGGNVLVSPDGIGWNTKTTNVTNVNVVGWNGSMFVAAGYNGTTSVVVATSTDGLTWVARTTPALNATPTGVAWCSGLGLWFIPVGASGMTSPDGITWTTHAPPVIFRGVAASSTTFVGIVNASGAGSVYSSTDGIAWTSRNPGANANTAAVRFGNGLFILEDGKGLLFSSADGITWTLRYTPSSTLFFGAGTQVNPGGLLYTGKLWLATLNDAFTAPNIIPVYSFDGLTWKNKARFPHALASPSPPICLAAAPTGGVIGLTATGGQLLISPYGLS